MGGPYLSKKEIRRYFRAIIEALNECELHFSPSPRLEGKRSCHGWYSEGVITIKNTPRTCNVVLYLIHEALHHSFPRRREKTIEHLARQSFCTFTTAQLDVIRGYIPVS